MAALARALLATAPDAVSLQPNFVRDAHVDDISFGGIGNSYDAFYPDGRRVRISDLLCLKYNSVTKCFEGSGPPMPPCGRPRCAHACSCVYHLEQLYAERPRLFANKSAKPDRAVIASCTAAVGTLLDGAPLEVQMRTLSMPGAMEYLYETVGTSDAISGTIPTLRRAYRACDKRWDLFWTPYDVDDRVLLLRSLPRTVTTPLFETVRSAVQPAPCRVSHGVRQAVAQRDKERWVTEMPLRTAYTAVMLLALSHKEYDHHPPGDGGSTAAPQQSGADWEPVIRDIERERDEYGFLATVSDYPHAMQPDANRAVVSAAADSLARSMYVQLAAGNSVSFRVSLPRDLDGLTTALRAMCIDGVDVHLSMSATYVVKRGD